MVTTFLLLVLFFGVSYVVVCLFFEIMVMYHREITLSTTAIFVAVYVVSLFAGIAAYMQLLVYMQVDYHITAIFAGILTWIVSLIVLNAVVFSILGRLTK